LILDQFSRFAGLNTQTNRHTDQGTCHFGRNRPHLCTACKRFGVIIGVLTDTSGFLVTDVVSRQTRAVERYDIRIIDTMVVTFAVQLRTI